MDKGQKQGLGFVHSPLCRESVQCIKRHTHFILQALIIKLLFGGWEVVP